MLVSGPSLVLEMERMLTHSSRRLVRLFLCSYQSPSSLTSDTNAFDGTQSQKKSLAVYEKIHLQHEAMSTMQTDSVMEEDEHSVPVKRGWRFYGTFATLALLNFICAIDATILAVALPVRSQPQPPTYNFATVLIILEDYCYQSERNNSYPGILGWDQFPFVRLTSTPSQLSSSHTTTDAQQSFSPRGLLSRTSSVASQSS